MQTVTIRELSGDVIARATTQGQDLVGVTNKGSLVGVLVPLTKDVLERMARRDEVDRQARVHAAEVEVASGHPLGTLSDLLDEDSPPAHAASGSEGGASFSRVGIRDLSGARLERAARDGETLLVSSGRVTLALLVPVTPDWVEHLVEGGVRRFIDGDPDRGRSRDPAHQRDIAPGGDVSAPLVRMSSGREFLRRRAIGIRIIADASDGPRRLQGVLTDMLAHTVGERFERTLQNLEERHVVAQILELVDDLRTQMNADDQLIGVGLEIGGHVHQGSVVYSANAHWEHFSLEDRLRNILGLPVVLENDANALAIYERRFEGATEDNLAVILLTRFGVGCGLIVDGRIHRGVGGMAGELGHIPNKMIDDDGLPCRCSNYDCLECFATPQAIEEMLRESGVEGGYEAALESVDSPHQRRAFDLAGTALGRATATVINILNPSDIVFYGPRALLGASREFLVDRDPRAATTAPHYANAMVDAIRNHTFSTGISHCQFTVRSSVDKYRARAAAACLIDSVVPEARVQDGRPVILQTR